MQSNFISALIRMERRKWALVVAFAAGFVAAMLLAFGVITIKELFELIAQKMFEISGGALLIAFGAAQK